ncbi:MAG: hypothetical protein QOJ79_2439 [Actinomycetota bacterium]|nr:hypothetical protein [Actinomycetota bacterium]
MLAVVGAQLLLPDSLLPGPNYVLPAIEGLLIAALVGADPKRLHPGSKDLRLLALAAIGSVAAVNGASLVLLVRKLVDGGFSDGATLLGAAAAVWLTNTVVFGLLYWELDRGGPLGRVGARPAPAFADLQFPQNTAPESAPPDWRPDFLDYLFVSLTSSTAFSPTDTMPLTRRAKLLMGSQSLVSLLTVGLVAARAVNVLRG